MGLGNNGASRIYLSISDGKIAQRCDENEQGAIKCSNKEGTSTWYEKRYGNVSGYIKDVTKRLPDNPKFGPQLQILIEDEGELFQLQMPWSSRYSNGFFKCMPNIDVSRKIEFNPWMKVVDNAKKTALYLKHYGDQDSIPWAWTKDDPKDLPPMVKIKVKGVETWDDSDQQEYFENYLNNVFKPRLQKVERVVPPNNFATAASKASVPSGPIVGEVEDDDLPF